MGLSMKHFIFDFFPQACSYSHIPPPAPTPPPVGGRGQAPNTPGQAPDWPDGLTHDRDLSMYKTLVYIDNL